MNPNEIYARGMVHLRGAEQALRDGIAHAEEADDTSTVARLKGALEQLESLHGRIDRITAPYVGGIRPLIGGGK